MLRVGQMAVGRGMHVRWDPNGNAAQGDQDKSETLFPRTAGAQSRAEVQGHAHQWRVIWKGL